MDDRMLGTLILTSGLVGLLAGGTILASADHAQDPEQASVAPAPNASSGPAALGSRQSCLRRRAAHLRAAQAIEDPTRRANQLLAAPICPS
jgi:hypothetical protein